MNCFAEPLFYGYCQFTDRDESDREWHSKGRRLVYVIKPPTNRFYQKEKLLLGMRENKGGTALIRPLQRIISLQRVFYFLIKICIAKNLHNFLEILENYKRRENYVQRM